MIREPSIGGVSRMFFKITGSSSPTLRASLPSLMVRDDELTNLPCSVCENPYAEFGRISSDSSTPEGNRWLPYDASCVPPPLLATLRSTLKKKPTVEDSLETLEFPLPKRRTKAKRKSLSWLQGKTVLLFGDHVERNHNKDFCRFAGGKWASIDRDHPLSPPPFVNGIDEKLPGAQQNSSSATRPSVCYLEEYDFMVVSVFHFGLANRVEFEHESLLYNPHFYPPGESEVSVELDVCKADLLVA